MTLFANRKPGEEKRRFENTSGTLLQQWNINVTSRRRQRWTYVDIFATRQDDNGATAGDICVTRSVTSSFSVCYHVETLRIADFMLGGETGGVIYKEHARKPFFFSEHDAYIAQTLARLEIGYMCFDRRTSS